MVLVANARGYGAARDGDFLVIIRSSTYFEDSEITKSLFFTPLPHCGIIITNQFKLEVVVKNVLFLETHLVLLFGVLIIKYNYLKNKSLKMTILFRFLIRIKLKKADVLSDMKHSSWKQILMFSWCISFHFMYRSYFIFNNFSTTALNYTAAFKDTIK